MSYLLRQLYFIYYVNGKPSHQLMLGIALIPLGMVIVYFALYGDPTGYYPFFVVFGVIFSLFGVILAAKGMRGILPRKPNAPTQQNTRQYVSDPSQAYGQPPVLPQPVLNTAQTQANVQEKYPTQQFYEQSSYGQTTNIQD